jgi:mannose-6-phosphate isomerase
VFFIPAGRVHSINAGILLAEIQQTSDLTYRIYDWDRKDEKGISRELHPELALDAIDFSVTKQVRTNYPTEINKSIKLAECQYFTVNVIDFDKSVEKDYNLIDSFVIYMCTKGTLEIQYSENVKLGLSKGETILIPAMLKNIVINPLVHSTLLEVYIK